MCVCSVELCCVLRVCVGLHECARRDGPLRPDPHVVCARVAPSVRGWEALCWLAGWLGCGDLTYARTDCANLFRRQVLGVAPLRLS